MESRSGRSKAGTLAALGTSFALHVGLAALLVNGMPWTGDRARPAGAISVSIAGPVAMGGAVAAASMVATETHSVAVPIESTPSRPAIAASPKTIQTAAPLAPAADPIKPATTEPATQIAAAQPVPEVSASQGPVPTPSFDTAPLVEAASASRTAVDTPTAVLRAPTPQQQALVGTAPLPPATAAASPDALPPPPHEVAIGSSRLPGPTTAVPSSATPGETTGVSAVDTAPVGETRPEAAQTEAHADLAPSLPSSRPELLAQAARPPDGAVLSHDESEAERARMIQSFIDRYDGGPCFLMAPASRVTSDLEVDGFATDTEKIHRFDDAFRAATGREAKIVGQWISPAQCAAVDFLQAKRPGAPGLKVEIERRDLRTGDVLSGTIDGGGGPDPVRLYWISETGSVTDVSDNVLASGERTSFAVPVGRNVVGGPYPQLIVAIVCDGTLIPDHEGLEADAFFATIEANARNTHRPLSVSGRPFRLLP